MHVTLMVEALTPQLSGIGRYSWELAQRLPKVPDIEEVRYRVPGRWVADPSTLIHGVSLPRPNRLVPRKIRKWWDRRILADTIVHGPNYFLPAEARTGVITVHDLSVFVFPDMHPPARVAQFERLFTQSIERASHLITDTSVMRNELLAFTGLPEDMVSVVSLGVGEAYHPRPLELLRPLLGSYDLAPGYGLCVSTLEPRKRIDRLLRAWSSLPQKLLDDHPLVLAGPIGWLNEELHDQISKGERAGWLRFLDFVPESDLPLLYAGAGLFIYPSIYEGFGLPPLEALASGVPTIVADRSCLPEVCGDAALKIDPDDDVQFAEAVLRGLTDEAWRKISIKRGLARAAEYSWARCAEETAAVYRQVWLAR